MHFLGSAGGGVVSAFQKLQRGGVVGYDVRSKGCAGGGRVGCQEWLQGC